ncbi:hypothetical protein [Hydrogenobaculum acidophilum]
MLHAFFAMFTGVYALTAFVAYLLVFTLYKKKSIMLFGLTNHGLSVIFGVLAVLTGFGAQRISYVMVKAPALFLFLHKWIAIFSALYLIGTFMYLWIKQEEAGRIKGIAIAVTGLFFCLLTVFLGLDIIFDFVAR